MKIEINTSLYKSRNASREQQAVANKIPLQRKIVEIESYKVEVFQ